MFDLIIRGALTVTANQIQELDVGVAGERIAAIALPGALGADSGRVIDGKNKILIPGGIEPHAHIAIPVPKEWSGLEGLVSQSPEAATRAAAFGGTTTVIDFSGLDASDMTGGAKGGGTHILDVLQKRRAAFQGRSYIDYAFHPVLVGDVEEATIGQIREAVEDGVPSFKVFTSFGVRVPNGPLYRVLHEVARNGGIVAVHAEDHETVDFMTLRLKQQGNDQAYNVHLAHNHLSEDLAFRRVLTLAKHAGAAVYFVHTSAREGVAAIAEARNQGRPAYGEALHNYLEFTCEDYKRPEGNTIHVYPGLKEAEDRDALLNGLLHGQLSTTATDEFTTSKEVRLWGKTIETLCGGQNGIETRLPVVFAKFVAQQHASLRRFVDITSTNAAKIFGLYPRKGVIAVGSDADCVLIDPTIQKRLRLEDLHSDCDHSIWENFQCHGYPMMTMVRGKVVVDGSKLVGDTSRGTYLKRKIGNEMLAGPGV